jgi:hypothetical protein
MSSCEHVPAAEFHGPAQKAFSRNSVHLLTRKEAFLTYESHRAYLDLLSYLWLLVPFLTFAALYSDCVCCLYAGMSFPLEVVGSTLKIMTNSQLFALAMLAALVFAYGSGALCAAVGSEDKPAKQMWAFVVSTVTAQVLLTVLFGVDGSYVSGILRRRLMSETAPGAWNTSLLALPVDLLDGDLLTRFFIGRMEAGTVLSLFLNVALPLGGPLMFASLILAQRKQFWRNSWHWPAPIITLPLTCSCFSLTWIVVAQVSISQGAAVTIANNSDFSAFLGRVGAALSSEASSGATNIRASLSCILSMFLPTLDEAGVGASWSSCIALAASNETLLLLWRHTLSLAIIFYVNSIFSPVTSFFLSLLSGGIESLFFSSLNEASRIVRLLVFGSLAAAVGAAVVAADISGMLTAAVATGACGTVATLVNSALSECDDD